MVLKSEGKILMFLQIMALSTLYARELCLLYFSNSGFVSNLYYTFIIIVVVWLGVSVFLTKTKEERNHLLLVFLIEIALMLYALFSSAQKRPVDANKMIGRIIALVLLHAIYRNNSRPSEGILKYNTVLNIIYAWSLLLLYAMGRGYDASGNLSFSFGNPNSTGLFVLLTIYSLIAGRACFIGFFSKLAIDSSIIAASVILYQSRSRYGEQVDDCIVEDVPEIDVTERLDAGVVEVKPDCSHCESDDQHDTAEGPALAGSESGCESARDDHHDGEHQNHEGQKGH